MLAHRAHPAPTKSKAGEFTYSHLKTTTIMVVMMTITATIRAFSFAVNYCLSEKMTSAAANLWVALVQSL